MPPDGQPERKSHTSDGTALLWLSGVVDDVTITRKDTIEDGEWYRSSAEIGIIEHVHGLDAAGAPAGRRTECRRGPNRRLTGMCRPSTPIWTRSETGSKCAQK